MMNIDIQKEWLETCGSSSLEGLLAEAGIYEPQPITFRFRQTSYAWRKENGGPDLYLVPEFVPYCLIESVLRLTAKGYKISLDWFS